MIRLSESEKDREGDFIWTYMDQAVSVNSYLNSQLFEEEDILAPKPLRESLFVQTLLDNALRRALLDILPDLWWSIMEKQSNHVRLISERMVAAGWCPYTVSFLEMKLQPDAQAFVFSLGTLRAQQDHTPCTSAGFGQIGCHYVAGQIDMQQTQKASTLRQIANANL
jgi:hypothetical protein